MTRRTFFPAFAAGSTLLSSSLPGENSLSPKGRLKQSVTKGVFRGRQMTLDDMCREAANAHVYGFDLIDVADWPILKKHNLVPTMMPGYAGTIPDGINRKENHDRLEKSTHEGIDLAAAGGCPNLITLSGSRRGMSDEEGADNCVAFLNRVKSHAEEKGVTICLELLNSKVNHPDYMCDHSIWGVNVMKRVDSPRVKLLYDIYHMQIMEGDIVRTIRENIQYIAHFHTGGNPGRHEIDQTQELNYRFIAEAIADLGFSGVVAHEYTPVRDPFTSLAQAVDIFTV
ncbi:MAG: TIM barrel protein [Acidobacteriaceae bacterium]|nr:TIM barrel protein [Acidobacteriaceae bacterium]MBV9501693.1 TIM barrel protein [Acidobacteriaceae bacterium]